MLIFEYQCQECLSVFEYLFFNKLDKDKLRCVFCDSCDVSRVKKGGFTPNKNFCPKKKSIVAKKDIRSSLIDVIGLNDAKCYSGCANKFNL